MCVPDRKYMYINVSIMVSSYHCLSIQSVLYSVNYGSGIHFRYRRHGTTSRYLCTSYVK